MTMMDFDGENCLHPRHWLNPTKEGGVSPLLHHHYRLLQNDVAMPPNLCCLEGRRVLASATANDDTAADAAASLLLLMVTWPRDRTCHRPGSYFLNHHQA
jgi:hypothetical protein